MQSTDKKRFATLLTGIADYYGKELSNSIIGLYWQGMLAYDIEAVEKALWEHTQNPDAGQFMPKIADITRTMQGRTQDQAAIAWGKVDAAVRRIGSYADVVFDDPLIHRVIVEMGGWIWLGQQVEHEWPFIAKRFEAMYRGYRMRGELPEYPPALIGLANAYNAREGYAAQTAMLVGDPRKAQVVQLSASDKPLLGICRADAFMSLLKLKQQPMTPIATTPQPTPTREAA
jgi:hypothetical protein